MTDVFRIRNANAVLSASLPRDTCELNVIGQVSSDPWR